MAKPELSSDARNTMALLCRAHKRERLSNKELKSISGAAVLELAEAGLLDLPVELVDMKVSDDRTTKLALRRTQEILLTDSGLKYCDAN